ncbi:PAS domain S-box protein [Flavobacteriaceae bacterium F08102]|nr:PAS domain S-box protein [Flavobacteriaceae bacterium F08102]
MNKPFTLKDEYTTVLQSHPHLYDWLTEDILHGVWYCNFKHPKDFYINDSFRKTLNYPTSIIEHPSTMFANILTPTNQQSIDKHISTCHESTADNFETIFSFKDFLGNTTDLKAYGKMVFEKNGTKKGLIIKFIRLKDTDENCTVLVDKIHALRKHQEIFKETNEIARVGGWEVDLVKSSVTWTKVTKDIHEVDQNYIPDITTGIKFYKEGYYRDHITKLFNNAVENGISFDEELKIVTAKGNEIWVRSFGKPEFECGKCVRIYGAFQDINEKKVHELKMKETQERFEKIFTNSSIGILLVDTNNKLLMVNRAILKIFQFKKSDYLKALNLTLRDMIHPDDLAKVTALRKKLINGSINHYKTEARYYTAEGKNIIWCTINTSMVRGYESKDDLIITQVEDISERKQLEQIALENSNKFMNAFEYSPNGMGVVAINGQWSMVNKNLSEIIGYSKEELLQLSFRDIVHPEDFTNDNVFLDELVNKKRASYSVLKRYIHKNGSIVHGHLTVSVLTDTLGNPISFIGQVVDMTENIQSELKLKKTLNDLQNLLAATTHVSIIETDLTGIVRKFNKGAENLLGYTAAEVIGTLNVGLLHDPLEVEQRSQELSAEFKKEIKGFDVFIYKTSINKHESGNWTYIRKDKKRLPVQLVVTSIRNAEQEITGYLGVASDIANLKEMEVSLVKSKLKAEAANKSKSEFLANMSHEIRTPLNGVIGFTDLLMRTKLSTVQRKYMHTVSNSANALLDLLNDILDFSKIEAGKLEINEERTDLIKLCDQTIDIIKHQAHEKGLEVLLDIPPNTKRFIQGDSVRLRQILTNLMGNAVKFTKTGEIELKIRTKPNPTNPNEMRYEFSIRDTGIGIAPENLKKIFTAFDQEDASTTRKYGGTGLGLTISNKLLGLMGSQLLVQSTMGIGSTFSFMVNFKIEDQKNHEVTVSKNIQHALIIDDNANNANILENMLAIDKIDSTIFSSGIDAIEFLEKKNPFNLAIIDYHMPYLNGLDLIRHLRKKMSLSAKALPIILLHSSGEDKKIQEECRDLDVQFNVVKPIQINNLYELIKNLQHPTKEIHKVIQLETEIDLSTFAFNILIAEDNPVNKYLSYSIIQKILPKATIYEASDGLEAIHIFKKEKIDLIFMDIQMSTMSGLEATEKIRALENNREHVPIIALTARTLKGERERCLASGMDDFITKPVVLNQLKKVIHDFLTHPIKTKSNIKSTV